MIARLWTRDLFVLAGLSLALSTPLAGQEAETKEEKEKEEEKLPLAPAGKMEFTTDEGTWMSLDVSPDGKTIVFDLLGDLYALPVEGGEAKRIVGEMSFESQPRFSPDGKQIVFVSDRSGAENLWLAEADGSNPKPLTKGRDQSFASPSWTRDGNYVVVSRAEPKDVTFSIWLFHKDGGTGVRLGPPDPTPPEPGSGEPPRPIPHRMGAVASPDGRFVYYSVRMNEFSYNVRFPLWQVVRFDRETGETATLTNAQGSAMRPLLSPDGKFLVYATRQKTATGLRVRELATGEERWLIYPVTRDDQESRASRDTMPGYAFLPDGSAILVPIAGKIHGVDFKAGRTTLIPFRAKVEAEMGPRVYFQSRVDDGPVVRARLIRWPALSPDGKRVAFSALNKLWIMDLPSGTPRRLTQLTAGEFMPSWSPDARYVVFVTWSTEGGHIFRVRSDGQAGAEQLTRRPAFYSYPIHSPDGARIVFVSGSTSDQLYSDLPLADGTLHCGFTDPFLKGTQEIGGLAPTGALELRWIPAEGGESTLIAATQGGRYPHFAADRERIYLTSRQGLTSLRLDGYDRRTHFKVVGTAAGPFPPLADEIRLSPHGERALVNLQNRHYLISVPRAGKETVEIKIAAKGDAALPVKKMSVEGGEYLGWSADGKTVTWAWGSSFYRQEISSDKPEVTEVVIEAPRAKPTGTVVLAGARIVSMKGDEVIASGDVVVTGNRITAVGAKGKVKVPSGARVIDVSGKTIIPGFVDVHSHMWAPRGVHQTQVWQYLANLAYGVTTTRDPQTSTPDVFTYADLVETGEILGPRVFATGPGVFSGSGLDDKEAVFNLIKRYRDAYRTATLKQYVSGDRIVRQWVIQACKELGITATTEGALDMKLDLTQMADGYSGHEHSLPLQPIYKDVAEFVARTETFYTPTILVAYGAPWTENFYFESTPPHQDRKLRRFIPAALLDSMVRRRAQWFLPEEYGHRGIAEGGARIVRAGGRVCLGSHGQLQGLGAHWEIWNLQSGGLTPHETLLAATLHGAQAIGLQQDVGSLEPGKLADLLVLDKNPLQDIRNTTSIRLVMKNGEIFNAETLDQVWPVEKKLPRMYWWDTDPPPPTPSSQP